MDLYPSSEKQLANIAIDPYVAATFFQHYVSSFVEAFIKGGMFGDMRVYYGNVKIAGHGSLHIHFVFWLKYAPLDPKVLIRHVIDEPAFRQKMIDFLDDLIQQDFSLFQQEPVNQPLVVPCDKTPKSSLEANKNTNNHHKINPCCNRCPDALNDEEFPSIVEAEAQSVIKECMIHKCWKHATSVCRFNFPHPLHNNTYFAEGEGIFHLRRYSISVLCTPRLCPSVLKHQTSSLSLNPKSENIVHLTSKP